MGLFDFIGDIFDPGGDLTVPAIDSEGIVRRQAQVNRITQTTPFGRLSYGGPLSTQLDFQLTPAFQNLLHQQLAVGGRGMQRAYGLLGAIPSGDQAVSAQLQRLQPGFDLQERNLRERLEQSGNPAAFGAMDMAPGAFNELALMNQMQNDARLAAVLQGPAYQGQLAQNALALTRASPVSVPQYNFQAPYPIDVTGAFGLGNQANMYNANVAQSQRSGLLGGLFDIGSILLGGLL